MRSLKIKIVIPFLLLQISCQTGDFIRGRVLDPANVPVEGASVKLGGYDPKARSFSFEIISETKTDEKGNFEIRTGDPKPENVLLLGVEKDGFKMSVAKTHPAELRKYSPVFQDYEIYLERK